jgi:preprotein translocase SecE subunit
MFVKPAVVSAVGSTFLSAALMIVVMLAAATGLVIGGRRLVGTRPPQGLRAGIFVGLLGVLLVIFAVRILGGILEDLFARSQPVVGMAFTAVLALVLFVLLGLGFFRQRFDRWLVSLEEQGWFSAAAYKRTQGLRVRRGTMLGILIVVGCGVYLLSPAGHNTFGNLASPHWSIRIPFTDDKFLILLPDLQFTVPILLTALSLWIAYRIVNFPPFADFLIATEAEMNKVSWETRKRLIQDSVVVLVTVVLLTLFLFVMDLVWMWVLSSRFVNVIQTPQHTAAASPGGAKNW